MNAHTPARTRNVTVACAQRACTWDLPANVDRAEKFLTRDGAVSNSRAGRAA